MALSYGSYRNVQVTPLLGFQGQINNATGTSNHTGIIFSCGPFVPDNRPDHGGIYNIKGVHNGIVHTFLAQCFQAGNNSVFEVLPIFPDIIE